jgi:hypothetical protein
MFNLEIPFFYRIETQDSGPIHINISSISTIRNSNINTNWSIVKINTNNNSSSFVEEYVVFISPEDLIADILQKYMETIKTLK